MSVTLRRAMPADAAALAALAARTFADTFGADNRPEDMAAHLASAYGVEQQGRELADPGWITVVAEEGTALVAFAQVRQTAAPDCVGGRDAVELHRFYVEAAHHGSGLAQRLMSAARAAAVELGGRAVWLSVWERNPRAIRFYTKCGFRDVGSKDFFVGPDRQTDRVLVSAVDSVIDS